ncbi:hypothetical protein D3C81_1854100 [compost metagenome]
MAHHQRASPARHVMSAASTPCTSATAGSDMATPARARPYTNSNIKGKASTWIRMALSAGARRICCSMG